MFANLVAELVDAGVVVGLLLLTALLWVIRLAGGEDNRVAPPARQIALPALVFGAGGGLVAAMAAVHAVSTRVTPISSIQAVLVAVMLMLAVQFLAGQVTLPVRAMLAAAVVLALVGTLFSFRLGASQQVVIALAALGAFWLFSRTEALRVLENPLAHRLVGVSALVCFALPLLAGQKVQDAYVQIELPVIGSVQTQDFGRVLLVVWLAGSLARQRAGLLSQDRRIAGVPVPDIGMMLTSVMPAFVGVALGVVSNDFGPVLVVAFVTTVMLALAGAKRRYFVTAGIAGALGFTFVALTVGKVANRIDALRKPISDNPDSPLTQVGTGLLAISHGGLDGLGLGRGMPTKIPAVRTDLILAGIGQELGVLTLLCVFAQWVLIAAGGFHIARRARNDGELLMASGLATMLLGQGLLVAGGVLGILPLTGMPVPFVSTSGSSLISAAMALGLLVAVGRVQSSSPTAPPALRSRLNIAATVGLVAAIAVAGVGTRYGMDPERMLAKASTRDPLQARLSMLNLGAVRTADGKLIAYTASSVEGDPMRLDNAVRYYPGGASYSALLGHTSIMGAATGLERALADRLRCRDDRRLTGNGCPTIRLTVDSRIQEVAATGMKGRTGAVIAVDLLSGGVLAFGSWPARDPAQFGDPAQVVEGGGTIDRVTGATTFPGSVAKIGVGIAGLEQDVDLLTQSMTTYDVAGGGSIGTFSDAPCGGVGMVIALAVSCNPEFAHIGAELGASELARSTQPLFNQQLELDGLKIQPSTLVPADGSTFLAAAGGIGMGDAQVTPFAINQLTALVARGGSPLWYHVVDDDPEGDLEEPRLADEVVNEVRAGMRAAVTVGTAQNIPGLAELDAAAKTGTADFATGLNNAWLTTYAPYDEPRFAVTVLIQPGTNQTAGLVGSRDAGPIAAKVLAACERWAR